MKQGTANLAEDYCFIHKALRPVGTARRQIAAVPPSNSRPVLIVPCDWNAKVGEDASKDWKGTSGPSNAQTTGICKL